MRYINILYVCMYVPVLDYSKQIISWYKTVSDIWYSYSPSANSPSYIVYPYYFHIFMCFKHHSNVSTV